MMVNGCGSLSSGTETRLSEDASCLANVKHPNSSTTHSSMLSLPIRLSVPAVERFISTKRRRMNECVSPLV